ncbi:uncharacterized protein YndB with AHSA1/START domain [Rhizobium pisi]|uniref:Uncharacterized protein YndB with AHSA1/START domain n=1 Tax=Rhizobium pisi TaxID=574561 RepID=A0A7W5G384_9HYPH|nr:uncharacterized protein YndB with AHSA1/START domain [Rhizobium pisi]
MTGSQVQLRSRASRPLSQRIPRDTGGRTTDEVGDTSPDKVYRAFIEADALAKWLPPNGFLCTVHHLEPAVGGTFRMSFRNFTTGNSHAFGGEFLDLVPGERVRPHRSSGSSSATSASLGTNC